jgi:hypothetical protein
MTEHPAKWMRAKPLSLWERARVRGFLGVDLSVRPDNDFPGRNRYTHRDPELSIGKIR